MTWTWISGRKRRMWQWDDSSLPGSPQATWLLILRPHVVCFGVFYHLLLLLVVWQRAVTAHSSVTNVYRFTLWCHKNITEKQCKATSSSGKSKLMSHLKLSIRSSACDVLGWVYKVRELPSGFWWLSFMQLIRQLASSLQPHKPLKSSWSKGHSPALNHFNQVFEEVYQLM